MMRFESEGRLLRFAEVPKQGPEPTQAAETPMNASQLAQKRQTEMRQKTGKQLEEAAVDEKALQEQYQGIARNISDQFLRRARTVESTATIPPGILARAVELTMQSRDRLPVPLGSVGEVNAYTAQMALMIDSVRAADTRTRAGAGPLPTPDDLNTYNPLAYLFDVSYQMYQDILRHEDAIRRVSGGELPAEFRDVANRIATMSNVRRRF